MWQRIQTIFYVSMITLLVWLYAEAENLKERSVKQEIEFVSPPGRDVLIDPIRTRVDVTIKGPMSILDTLPGVFKVRVSDDLIDSDPKQIVNLAERIGALPEIANVGLTVIDVKPRSVEVRVERMESRTLLIDAVAEGDFQFDSKPLVEPAQATVTLPVSRLALIDETTRLRAQLDPEDLRKRETNQLQIIENVPLVLPESLRGQNSRIDPPAATVSLTIVARSKALTLPSIPIRLVAPPSVVADYQEVVLENNNDQFLRNINLSGPNRVIDDILRNDIKVWAALMLTSEDLARAVSSGDWTTGSLTIMVPHNVTVLNPPPQIKYRVLPNRFEPASRAPPPAEPAVPLP